MSPKSATRLLASARIVRGCRPSAAVAGPLAPDNVLYFAAVCTDPMVLLGYFKDLVDFKRDLFPSFHGGSRYSWDTAGLPGSSLFSPVTANFILHLAVTRLPCCPCFRFSGSPPVCAPPS